MMLQAFRELTDEGKSQVRKGLEKNQGLPALPAIAEVLGGIHVQPRLPMFG
ncbi:hypothetical protein D3C83_198510 [compost metagenome]